MTGASMLWRGRLLACTWMASLPSYGPSWSGRSALELTIQGGFHPFRVGSGLPGIHRVQSASLASRSRSCKSAAMWCFFLPYLFISVWLVRCWEYTVRFGAEHPVYSPGFSFFRVPPQSGRQHGEPLFGSVKCLRYGQLSYRLGSSFSITPFCSSDSWLTFLWAWLLSWPPAWKNVYTKNYLQLTSCLNRGVIFDIILMIW